MPHETRPPMDWKVIKRNGRWAAFNPRRIEKAVGNAFKQHHGLPRETVLPSSLETDVRRAVEAVLDALRCSWEGGRTEPFSVEEIQDEVTRVLRSGGWEDVARLYAEYRRAHADRRKLFESFVVLKRDGRPVSFKAEKILAAVAAAFRAQEGGDVSEDLLRKARAITAEVVARIREGRPEGGEISIEEIQDLVQQTLKDAGEEDVAQRYIRYREQRARLRRKKDEASKEAVEEEPRAPYVRLHVRDAAGGMRPLDQNAAAARMRDCCAGLEGVRADELLAEAVKNYFDGMSEDDISAADIMAARSFVEREPNYAFVAARLLLLKHYRDLCGREVGFAEMEAVYREYFPRYVEQGIAVERLHPDLKDFDLEFLASCLRPERDLMLRYMGLQILYDRYFIHDRERRIELPQIFWMRVAMGLARNEGDQRDRRAAEFYEVLSTFRFVCSTPTLFNAGTPHSQLSSCFLTTIEDDLFQIFKAIRDDAMLSKWSGGLGNDWTNIRAMGAWIKGTNGKSQGIVPFLKVANDTALAVNQGGKRQGAMCAYLELWHKDVEDFLELRKNTGDERRRTHDMHTAVWIPDLFMKRVRENGEWTLFSPDEVPDLHHVYGRRFEERYVHYENEARAGRIRLFKTMPAVQLWRRCLSMLFETGHPWLTWKDPSNIRSPQDHVGVVHSSNLCTEILLNTSKEETAVCNLGSINLAAHTTPEGLDLERMEQTLSTAVRMLDNVIDNNFYPTPEARTANQRHRPIGLGIMGFQDALFIQGLGYASPEAVVFADRSMEAVSYYTILASARLAAERGTYSTYRGSKWDRGLLPIDTLDLLEEERGGYLDVDRSSTMDWSVVRETIHRHGMRNSNCLAIAPTATIANIIGVTSSIEPIYKNIFVKSNLSGEFTVINEYLVRELRALGLWDAEMIDDLKYFDGSVQEIDRVPAELKQRYATAFEIEYEWLIEAASRRQKWIDMGQSLNLYQAKPSGKTVSDMYLMAWEKGLKTTYYLRSLGATRIEKSSLDITKAKYVGNILGRRQRDAKGRVTEAAPACRLTGEPAEECEACQ